MDVGLAGLVLVAAFAPPVGWTWFFYHRDRYEREPRRLIGLLFLVGALVTTPAALIVNTLLGAIIGGSAVILLAGVTEEPLKFATVAWRTRRHRDLDEPVDGMIYGATVGLGFAAAETTLYIIDALVGDVALRNLALGVDPFTGAFVVTAPLRALTSALMHAFCSGIAGYYFARLVLDGSYRHSRMAVPLAGVAVAHGIYNLAATLNLLLAIAVLIGIGVVFFRTLGTALAHSPHRREQLELPAVASIDGAPPVPRRPCPRCAEFIAVAARRCRFCGTDVEPSPQGL